MKLNFQPGCDAHFIGIDWKLHKKIINFVRIYSHKGSDVAKCYQASKKEVRRVGDSTTSGKICAHAMCCTYNKFGLVVSDGLEEVTMSVRRVREAVRFVRGSPLRWSTFKECVNLHKVQTKKLVCMDVATRWNSTYLMLQVAEAFEKPFKSLEEVDLDYKSELLQKKYKGMIIGPPNHEDWESVRNLLPYLQFFYDLTVLASGTSYVTAHMVLGELINVFLHIREMAESADGDVRKMAEKMLLKVGKYWCEREGDNSRLNKLCYLAVVLDPRHKLDFPKYAFSKMYGPERGEELQNELIEDLNELFAYYEGRYNAANEIRQQSCPPQASIPQVATTTLQNLSTSRA
ncbi:Putative AC transposase [Linum grandiflorum]